MKLRLLAAVSAAILVLSVAAGSATAKKPAPRRAAVRVALAWGNRIANQPGADLTVAVRTRRGRAIRGAKVVIQARTAAGAWRRVAVRRTSRRGVVHLDGVTVPKVSESFRAVATVAGRRTVSAVAPLRPFTRPHLTFVGFECTRLPDTVVWGQPTPVTMVEGVWRLSGGSYQLIVDEADMWRWHWELVIDGAAHYVRTGVNDIGATPESINATPEPAGDWNVPMADVAPLGADYANETTRLTDGSGASRIVHCG